VNFEIIEIEELSGRAATIYTVLLSGSEQTVFDNFLEENKERFKNEIKFIVNRLYEIGHRVGAREGFFKPNEGKPGDGVCALYDLPDSKLRLYCIRYGNVAIILGGGGEKPKSMRAWQESEKLSKEASRMIQVSEAITARLKSGDIEWSRDGSALEGDLNFGEDEDY